MKRRAMLLLTLTLPVTSCGVAVSDSAVCAVTAVPTTEHARALAEDGGDASVVTGLRLIRTLDGACGR